MRNVSGIFFLDKVSGISSFSLLRQVKTIFQAKKAGYIGTLDPLATGMLPICLGEATKFSQYLLFANKSYRVVAKLGESTDTFDAFGKIVHTRSIILHNIFLYQALSVFVGKSYQVPPMFSAIKHFGYPLYKYARQGMNVARNSRLINIFNIKLIRWSGRYLELEIFCSKGTYVRSFVNDLGEYLGCGAHVVSLKRLSLGYFRPELMINISVLQEYYASMIGVALFKELDKLLYPIDIMVRHLPKITVSMGIYRLLRCGQKVAISNRAIIPYNISDIRLVRMFVGLEKKFFGVGKVVDKNYLLADRLLIF